MTIFLTEGGRWQGRPLFEAILELLLAKGLAGATVTRALEGYTRDEGIATMLLVDRSVDLPL